MLKHLLSGSVALLIVTASAQTGDFNLPDFGDPSAAVISPIEEQRLGRRLIAQARRAFPYVTDPEIDAYISQLGQRLLASSDLPNQEFHFYLIDQSSINAFAIPGGHISLNTGLIASTNTESELAGVMAHEIVHVTQRHLPRMIARQKELTVPAAAAIIGGILLGGQAGAAAIIGSNAGLIGDQLSYTRDFEREADAFGIEMMVNAGFNPYGMPGFFQVLLNKTKLLETSAPEFLRTHPLTINRISESENRAQRYEVNDVPSSPDYYYMREKIKALADNKRSDKVAEDFKARLAEAPENLKTYIEYGYAYALMENKQFPQALSIAQRLKKQDPNTAYLDNLLAQIQASSGNFKNAIATIAQAIEQHPDNQALKVDYADILLKAGNAKQSEQVLRKLLKTDRSDPFLYRLYARANGEIGNTFESHRALGEYYVLRGNYKAALDHFHRAKNNAGDSYYNQASIDARIQQVQDEKIIFEGKG